MPAYDRALVGARGRIVPGDRIEVVHQAIEPVTERRRPTAAAWRQANADHLAALDESLYTS